MEEVLEKDKTHRSSSNSPSDQASSLEVMGLSYCLFFFHGRPLPPPSLKNQNLHTGPKAPQAGPCRRTNQLQPGASQVALGTLRGWNEVHSAFS